MTRRNSAQSLPIASTTPHVAPISPLVAAEISAWDRETRAATLRVGGVEVPATLSRALSGEVVESALARGEVVIAQEADSGWVVLGALRTAPTPGVDRAEEYVISANRIRIEASDAISLVSGAAELVIVAYGRIEAIAKEITSRASSVNKVIGRIIRLN